MTQKLKRQTVQPTNNRPIEVLIAFEDARCDDCAVQICSGGFVFKEGARALCMKCAELDHLCYLPRGNAALTRRATKYSTLTAPVLKWSRRCKRYERQGILVEAASVDRAAAECSADADIRASRQARDAERRQVLDAEYIKQFHAAIVVQFPGCPSKDAKSIAEHACQKYSGRVGRSAAAKQLDADAITLAVRAHIRHVYSKYDMLLSTGWSRREARDEVAAAIAQIVVKWKAG